MRGSHPQVCRTSQPQLVVGTTVDFKRRGYVMELLKLTPIEFSKMAKLVYERAGIHLPDTKLTLLSNRLRRRLRELKLASFGDYYRLLCNPVKCDEELPHFLSAITTNETYFFRNDNLWKFFRGRWIPEMIERRKLKRPKSIRLWSAASSSGEEAYTAAICLREDLSDFNAWNVTLVGSDISQRVLKGAAAGEYNSYAVSKMSKFMLHKWFDHKNSVYLIKPELRKMVTFQFHNLRDPNPSAPFDLVFLRNVLMYFDLAMKQRVLQNVAKAIVPGGYLVVGDVDPIRNSAELNQVLKLDYNGPNVYRKPERCKTAAAMAMVGS